DPSAETTAQPRRQASAAVVRPNSRRGSSPRAKRAGPAAHSPAAEASAATPLGTSTRSGKNSSAAVSRPASHQTASCRFARPVINPANLAPRLGAYFDCREEKADLPLGIFGRIRPVHRIRLDRLRKVLAD